MTAFMNERARRAGDKPIEHETFVPLIDVDPTIVAEFLAPKSWGERAAYVDNIILDSLGKMGRVMDFFEVPKAERLGWTRDGIGEMRGKIAAILDELDRLAPLPLDDEAMRLFRVSIDPEHVAVAARHWPTKDDELAAMRAVTGCMMLRNLALALKCGE